MIGFILPFKKRLVALNSPCTPKRKICDVFLTIHLINMYYSFQNNVHTAKQMQYTLEGILSDF